ncbi:MAG TPA: aminopeptidase [Rhodocyclaceae bacterium]|nr:aminopeptidase [Rhodocyclaceae bacterium]HNC61825.1 aminopeptidase [Rhodocyclaceae bacterium]HNH13312.1 aminopeptidase [Rhodocyclaceae bacterium]HNH98893.1 aminopeptidase [Rhodocyclaceae bacterium]
MRRRLAGIGVALAATALLGACGTPGYYLQAAGGQLEILRLSRPLDDARIDPATPDTLRDKLARAAAIRDFASRELGLPDNGSYRKYADLGRPYVVWNVFATDELSIEPREWCFPIAGCVSYRGYFAEADAEAFAAALRAQGNDVHVAGIAAYSTLGWLDDPLLNTFIHYPEIELARLIFHELAHQRVYAAGDSEFNESFAMAVEVAGVRRWLAREGSDAQRAAFASAQRRRDDFASLVLKYRDALDAAFRGDADAAHKRAEKARILSELQAEYRALRDGVWGGYSGYDRWFGQEINNAVLASIGLYHQRVPAFEALLAAEGGDLPRFYEHVAQLARLSKDRRDAELARAVASATARR